MSGHSDFAIDQKPAKEPVWRLGRVFRLSLFCVGAAISCSVLAADPPTDPEAIAFFESKIRPVLIKECYGCHSNQSGNARGGLRLDTRQLTQIGGDSGPAIVGGDLDESLLWAAINYDGYEMPPRGRLSDSVISDFRRWIEMGAPDPRETEVTAIEATVTAEDIAKAKESFWAYQQPVAANGFSSGSDGWSTTPIDRFIVAKLRSEGLRPVGDASAETVLRRLTFGLIGLPPTNSQRKQFLRAWQTDARVAIEQITDQLLETKQFGERWGRHWLDIARYAESTGRGVNMSYPHAWRYRDYVIDSFNDDKSYYQFVQEQLAGDLLPAPTDEQWAENLIATTFLAIGPKNVNERNPVQFAADLVDEQIDVTTRVFLGQSVACARCHDHKFDPIPQTDYYAMAGIFSGMKTYFGNPPSEFGGYRTAQTRRNSSLMRLPIDDANPFDPTYTKTELEDLLDEIRQAQDKLSQLGGRREPDNQRQRLRLLNQIAQLSAKLAVVDDQGKPRSYCMGVQDPDDPHDVRILARGEIDAPGQVVPRGFPQVLCSTQPNLSSGNSSGRLELARWIGSPDNPLTSRVMANRVWQHLFGRGLVSTPENFGFTGATASHPELLDHLAIELQKTGGSIKSLIRQIVTSHVYRISSQYDPTAFQADPENQFLWRFSPRRLDAESIRDAMLQVSGDLDLRRPRGSLIAKSGYVRLRDGTLTTNRNEVRRKVIESVRKRMQAEGVSPDEVSRGRRRRNGAGRGEQNPRVQFRELQGRGRELAAQELQKILRPLEQEDDNHRSVYLTVVRDQVPRSLDVFDFADPDSSVGKRESSNTANQALYLMNNPFVVRQSDALAQRIASDKKQPLSQIQAVFDAVYGRPPTTAERSAVFSLVRALEPKSSNRSSQGISPKTLSVVCQSLFASAEFLYLD